MNSYACQELLQKRLRQQQEKNDEKKCECCGEAESADVAWCTECSIICKSCLRISRRVLAVVLDNHACIGCNIATVQSVFSI